MPATLPHTANNLDRRSTQLNLGQFVLTTPERPTAVQQMLEKASSLRDGRDVQNSITKFFNESKYLPSIGEKKSSITKADSSKPSITFCENLLSYCSKCGNLQMGLAIVEEAQNVCKRRLTAAEMGQFERAVSALDYVQLGTVKLLREIATKEGKHPFPKSFSDFLKEFARLGSEAGFWLFDNGSQKNFITLLTTSQSCLDRPITALEVRELINTVVTQSKKYSAFPHNHIFKVTASTIFSFEAARVEKAKEPVTPESLSLCLDRLASIDFGKRDLSVSSAVPEKWQLFMALATQLQRRATEPFVISTSDSGVIQKYGEPLRKICLASSAIAADLCGYLGRKWGDSPRISAHIVRKQGFDEATLRTLAQIAEQEQRIKPNWGVDVPIGTVLSLIEGQTHIGELDSVRLQSTLKLLASPARLLGGVDHLKDSIRRDLEQFMKDKPLNHIHDDLTAWQHAAQGYELHTYSNAVALKLINAVEHGESLESSHVQFADRASRIYRLMDIFQSAKVEIPNGSIPDSVSLNGNCISQEIWKTLTAIGSVPTDQEITDFQNFIKKYSSQNAYEINACLSKACQFPDRSKWTLGGILDIAQEILKLGLASDKIREMSFEEKPRVA